jgi:protein SCO1
MRSFLVGLAALGMAFVFAGPAPADSASGTRRDAEYFTNLPVITHEGKTARFYDDLIKGRKVVFNFAYLNCTDICPLATSRLAEVKRRLGDAVGRDVFFYTITMDPARDTPELLKMYADAFDAGPGWQFLTGKPEDIEQIRYRLGDRARKLSEHRNDLILGNDAEGDWARSSTFADLNVLVATIRELDPAYRAQVHDAPPNAVKAEPVQFVDTPGSALFAKACSTCHTIGGGKLVGPDLKGVAERRESEWLHRFLTSPSRMRAQHDPIVAALSETFKGVRMPDLGLQEDDVTDLLQYIDAHSHNSGAAATTGGASDGPEAGAPHG